MANTLSNNGIVDGQTIFAAQVNQIVDSLTGADAYDISISGSLNVVGGVNWAQASDAAGLPVEFVVRSTGEEGELYVTASSAFDIKLSGSFPAERLVITENTSSANAGGLATSNNLRTFNDNNGIVIGGSEGSNGVVGLGLIISEDSGNGNHTIVSDGSGSNLNIRAAGGDDGDTYVVILSDQPGTDISDVFEIAKFGGPLRGTELYHTGSLVFNTAEIGANKGVIITGTISASADAYLPGLSNTTVPHIVGFDTSSGQLTYYSTASFGGGSTDTGSLMVTGSVTDNVLTFTKGDGSTFNLTVDTGSAATVDTGSFYISSSVSNATITFTQGDGTTEQVTVNNVVSSSYALTSSHTPEALITASLAGSDLTFTKGDSSQFSLTLPGGGSGNPITGSYTGSVLTTTIQSINWTGSGVQATVGGANDITVYIPGGSSTDTGSFYYSSSVVLNTITFYQGDGTTETVTVDTGSAATVDTGSLMVTGSATNNVLTFTKGNGSTFNLTVDTGSAATINTGSFYYSSSISNATITFNQGDGTTEQVTVNNVNNAVSSSFATTASYVLNAVSSSFATTASYVLNAVSASYAPSFNIYNIDGELTGNRTVTLGGNGLTFVADQGETFEITSDPGSTVQIPGLTTGSQAQIIGYNFSTGKLYAMNTSSIAGGGTTDTGSLLTTGSVSNATLTFTKGDGSTFPLTVNNVANATTAGSVASDSVYSEAADFDVWATAGNTFTLLDLGGTNIQATAPKNAEGGSKLLAVTTMEVYRGDSGGAEHTTFEYRLYNSTQTAVIPGSTRNFSSYLLGSGEGAIPTTFTFTLPISSDVSSGDTIELQVRQTQGAASTYLSASISYADLSLVSITN